VNDPSLFERKRVPQLDIKRIFEKAAGHPANQISRTITHPKPEMPEINAGRTLSGRMKPTAFVHAPSRRVEQFFV
jgi:hypothetical protein